MNSRSRLFSGLLVFATILLAAPVSTTAAGMLGTAPVAGTSVGSLDIPSVLTAEDVRDEIVFSLVARGWAVKEKSGQHVVGYLNHRGHEATITFVLRPEAIDIFCEGYRVSSNGQRTKPALPEGWIANLKKDIPRRLAAKAATK